jgi:hypothetical protein
MSAKHVPASADLTPMTAGRFSRDGFGFFRLFGIGPRAGLLFSESPILLLSPQRRFSHLEMTFL